ncbi:hypothetical protein N7466_001257 [Penicillium verhagenii]|uniref:uncharacterized protein n=1 Tax=Penicillium verhagenii TaxID=1562060 RepID=UPI00254599D9|nr:uncharacterized protein N7466_001257 [Penicillium verhagenii]KAJ5948242.1 hypothetical protein N7466_001257 [Penicillium verhagenii]
MLEDGKLEGDESVAMTLKRAEESKKTPRIHGVYYRALATAGVLVVNLFFIGLAVRFSKLYTENDGFTPTALVYRGSCTPINRWETALSLMINILSEVALGASN